MVAGRSVHRLSKHGERQLFERFEIHVVSGKSFDQHHMRFVLKVASNPTSPAQHEPLVSSVVHQRLSRPIRWKKIVMRDLQSHQTLQDVPGVEIQLFHGVRHF